MMWQNSKNSGVTKSLLEFDMDIIYIRDKILSSFKSKTYPIDMYPPSCPRCGSKSVKKKEDVKRIRKGSITRYKCNICGYSFVENYLPSSHLIDWAIIEVIELTTKGERPSSIVSILKEKGISITRPTIYRIIREVANILEEFESNFIRVKTSDEWQIDDMWMQVKGKTMWITNVIDVETRYWLASYVSGRGADASKIALSYAKTISKTLPKRVKCDGYQGHKKAIAEVLPNVELISVPKSKDFSIVNQIECLHSWIRKYLPRKGSFRSLENLQAFVTLLRFKHNFFRVIDGKTPVRSAGIPFSLDSGWKFLLKIAKWSILEYSALINRRHPPS